MAKKQEDKLTMWTATEAVLTAYEGKNGSINPFHIPYHNKDHAAPPHDLYNIKTVSTLLSLHYSSLYQDIKKHSFSLRFCVPFAALAVKIPSVCLSLSHLKQKLPYAGPSATALLILFLHYIMTSKRRSFLCAFLCVTFAALAVKKLLPACNILFTPQLFHNLKYLQ